MNKNQGLSCPFVYAGLAGLFLLIAAQVRADFTVRQKVQSRMFLDVFTMTDEPEISAAGACTRYTSRLAMSGLLSSSSSTVSQPTIMTSCMDRGTIQVIKPGDGLYHEFAFKDAAQAYRAF